MSYDFAEILADGAAGKVYADKVIAFAKSLKRAEGEPAPSVQEITKGIAGLVEAAGVLAQQVIDNVKD